MLSWTAYAAEGGLLFGAARDVTEHKKMEEDLRNSEEKWRSITESSPDHIMLIDLDAKILYINRTVPDLTIDEVIGRSQYDFVPQEWQKDTAACYKRVIETGKPSSYSCKRTSRGSWSFI